VAVHFLGQEIKFHLSPRDMRLGAMGTMTVPDEHKNVHSAHNVFTNLMISLDHKTPTPTSATMKTYHQTGRL
jgi:hypothetical protein